MVAEGAVLAILGVAAGILILTGWVHQIIHGYRTKSLGDVSGYLIIMIGVGAALWTIYGIAVLDGYIIGTNVAAMVLMTIVLIMKRRYDRMKNI